MDTNFKDADLTHAGIGLSPPISLPGEQAGGSPPDAPESAASDPAGLRPASPAVPSAPKRRSRRGKLLASVGVLVGLGAAGAGAYVFRDKIAPVASPDLARGQEIARAVEAKVHASVGPAIDRAAATTLGWFAASHVMPAAASREPQVESVEASPAPTAPPPTAASSKLPIAAPPVVSEPGFTISVAAVSTASAPPRTPDKNRTDIAEIAALKAPNSASSSDTSRSNPPAATRPDTALSAASPPSTATRTAPRVEVAEPGLAMASPIPSASPEPQEPPPVSIAPAAPASAPAAVGPPSPAPPRDAIATAIALHASPMTTPQQVAVLGLVKDLAAQLRDTRLELAQMHQTVSQLATQVETKTSDFDARLSMAEAAAMVQSSAKAATPTVPATDTEPRPATAASTAAPVVVRVASARGFVPASVAAPASTAVAPSDRRTVKDYVLKGASPGIAVLASLNPAPGSAAVIQVGVGDPVPGLGHVKRVYQRGMTWIVDTDSGSIQ